MAPLTLEISIVGLS